MVDSICDWLLKKNTDNDPSINEEKSEIIYYGLQNIIGELPKGIFILIVAWICGVLDLVFIGTIPFLIYRGFAGGAHLKTHISCLVISILLIIGSAFLAKNFLFENPILIYTMLMIFNLILAILYAPADTEAVPILRKKDRNLKRKLSYITMTLTLICAVIIKNNTISNLLIVGTLMQTLSISGFMYKITKCKFGYREYIKLNNIA